MALEKAVKSPLFPLNLRFGDVKPAGEGIKDIETAKDMAKEI
jgi:hypothetical protein